MTNGYVVWHMVNTTTNTTAAYGDCICVDPSGGGVTITAPAGGPTVDGRSFMVFNDSSSTNTITISGASNINGGASITITVARGWYEITWNQAGGEFKARGG